MRPNPEDLSNEPENELRVEEIGRCIVTRSLLTVTASGVHDACLFPGMPKRLRMQTKAVGLLSLLKNKLHTLDLAGKAPYFVMNLWATGYHHWLAEVVPKFFLFENELRGGTVLIPERRPRFIDDFLEMFAFDNVSHWRDNAYVKNLRVVTNPNSGHFLPEHLLPARARIQEKLGIKDQKPGRRLYVSRRNARSRRVINEDEVVDALAKQGFETIELEEVSFEEQVRLFSECEMLVSIHGAALTNALFMPDGGRVIELYPAGTSETAYFNACYYRMCNMLGLRHSYVFCDREFPEKQLNLDTDNVLGEVIEILDYIKQKKCRR